MSNSGNIVAVSDFLAVGSPASSSTFYARPTMCYNAFSAVGKYANNGGVFHEDTHTSNVLGSHASTLAGPCAQTATAPYPANRITPAVISYGAPNMTSPLYATTQPVVSAVSGPSYVPTAAGIYPSFAAASSTPSCNLTAVKQTSKAATCAVATSAANNVNVKNITAVPISVPVTQPQ